MGKIIEMYLFQNKTTNIQLKITEFDKYLLNIYYFKVTSLWDYQIILSIVHVCTQNNIKGH